MNNSEKKSLANELYFNTDKKGVEIAHIVQITPKTFYKWVEEENWDKEKQASENNRVNTIVNLYKQAGEIASDPNPDIDALIKISSTITKLSNGSGTISTTINVMQEFQKYVYDQEPDMARTIQVMNEKYLQFKIKNR